MLRSRANKGRRRRGATRAVFAATAISLLCLPLACAEVYSRLAAQQVVRDQANIYAQDALHRSEEAMRQVDASLTWLARTPGRPCDPRRRVLMRQIDVSSSYIQAVGHIAGNKLICSSLDEGLTQIDLGPADFRAPGGIRVRAAVTLPFAPTSTFIIVEREGYVAVVHKALPIDVATGSSGVSLATVALPGGQLYAGHKAFDKRWLERLTPGGGSSYISEGRAIATRGSGTYAIGAVAAMPKAALTRQIAATRLRTLPVGLLIGVVLVGAALAVARRQASMSSELKAALRRDELFLLYQPVIDLRTGTCRGAEALLRWRKRDGSLVPPDTFIPVAEHNGIVQSLTRRVCALVQADAAGLLRDRPDFHVAINVAAADMHDEATVDLLTALSTALGAAPGQVVVELTERGFVEHGTADSVLAGIRAAGMTSAIDDFGTGYSSLASLHALDLDVLKIDKSFVSSIGADAATSSVIFHIIDMARALGMTMIAEGVETHAQAEVLSAHGVQLAQGWLFGKPMPLAEIVKMLPPCPKRATSAPSAERDLPEAGIPRHDPDMSGGPHASARS